jgi:hypothetical protein
MACAGELTIYKGKYASAVIVNSNGRRILLLAGGAIPRGAATSADCFIEAEISLQVKPSYYEGNVLPVSNELVLMSASDVMGKKVGIYLYKNKLRVGGVDTTGICADFIDFSGDYVRLSNSTRQYKDELDYFSEVSPNDLIFSEPLKDGVLSIDAAGAIHICATRSNCKKITPEGELQKAIDEGNENLSIVDIYEDGNQEVAATTGNDVNQCSIFFSFNRATHTFSALDIAGKDRDICNYKLTKNHLISSYRSAAKWYEDIYELKNGIYQLVLSDACVGCDQITRSVYRNGKLAGKLLVTDRRNYSERRPIMASVTVDKAWLYSEPVSSSITAMYLIKDDKVQLLEDNAANVGNDSDDSMGYLVKYITKGNKSIIKWMKYKDLAEIASVTVGKAWLYSKPMSSSITEMYLVKGDKVQVLDVGEANEKDEEEGNDPGGFWYQVKYITKENKTIINWVKCEDLAKCN